MNPASLTVVAWSGLVVITVIVLVLFITGLRGDPSRGRLRCRKCWQRLEGLPRGEAGWICPECGEISPDERSMRRRRVYTRRVYAAIIVFCASAILAYAPIVQDRWNKQGISALVPTTLLVHLYPDDIDTLHDETTFGRWVHDVLYERRGATWAWQRGRIEPPEIPFGARSLHDFVRTPDRWYLGGWVEYELDVPAYTDGLLLEEVMLYYTGPDGRRVSIDGARRQSRPLSAPAPRASPRSTTVLASYDRSSRQRYSSVFSYATPGVKRFEWHGQDLVLVVTLTSGRHTPFDVNITREYTLELPDTQSLSGESQAHAWNIEPASDPALDAWLLDQPLVSLIEWGYTGARIAPNPPSRREGAPEKTLFAMDLEVWADGERTILYELERGYRNFFDLDPTMEALLGEGRASCEALLSGMTLRLVPRPERVVGAFNAERYWVPSGDRPYLEVPLLGVLRLEIDRPGWTDPLSDRADEIRQELHQRQP